MTIKSSFEDETNDCDLDAVFFNLLTSCIQKLLYRKVSPLIVNSGPHYHKGEKNKRADADNGFSPKPDCEFGPKDLQIFSSFIL